MSLSHNIIAEGIYHIGDGRGNFCTLIVGESGAVLYDTLMGFDDLKGYVAGLTGHTPTVINSHCHFDHMGGNGQFDRVCLGRDDLALLELGAARIPILTVTLNADLSHALCAFTDRDRIDPVDPGTVLDLGGKTVEVIAMPGHTPGHIGLLCREDRLLLAGDGLSPQFCIFFRESLPLADNVDTMKRLRELPFDRFLSSHFDFAFPKSVLGKFEACLELPGKKRGMDYNFPALPDEHGKFFVLTPCDPEIGQLIGVAVKESDAPDPPRTSKRIEKTEELL